MIDDLEYLILPEDGEYHIDISALAEQLQRWNAAMHVRPGKPPRDYPSWAACDCCDIGERLMVYNPRPAGETFFLRGKITETGMVAWYAGVDSFAAFALWYRVFVPRDYVLAVRNATWKIRFALEPAMTLRQVLNWLE
jgi:hypothetical protein